MSYTPELGDIIYINCNPQSGYEQAGERPVIVLTPKKYNKKTNLILCCPITNKRKGYPWEIELPEKCKVTGVILSDQIRCFDWKTRKAEFKCKSSGKVIEEVKAKIKPLLNIK